MRTARAENGQRLSAQSSLQEGSHRQSRGGRASLRNKGRPQCAYRGCGPGELEQLTRSGVSWGWVRGCIWLSLVGSKLEAGKKKKEKEASVIDQVLWLGADELLFGCLDYCER